MGVEQEFLRSYPAAILSYKKAVNFAEKHLGPDDGITQNLRNVYENAKNEVSLYLTYIIIFSWMWLYSRKLRRVLQIKALKQLRPVNITNNLKVKKEEAIKNRIMKFMIICSHLEIM